MLQVAGGAIVLISGPRSRDTGITVALFRWRQTVVALPTWLDRTPTERPSLARLLLRGLAKRAEFIAIAGHLSFRFSTVFLSTSLRHGGCIHLQSLSSDQWPTLIGLTIVSPV